MFEINSKKDLYHEKMCAVGSMYEYLCFVFCGVKVEFPTKFTFFASLHVLEMSLWDVKSVTGERKKHKCQFALGTKCFKIKFKTTKKKSIYFLSNSERAPV